MNQSGVYHNAGRNSMSSFTFPILLFLSRVLTMLQSTRNSRSIVPHWWNNCTGQFRSIIWKAIIIIFVFSLLHLNNQAPELRSPDIFIELKFSRELKKEQEYYHLSPRKVKEWTRFEFPDSGSFYHKLLPFHHPPLIIIIVSIAPMRYTAKCSPLFCRHWDRLVFVP